MRLSGALRFRAVGLFGSIPLSSTELAVSVTAVVSAPTSAPASAAAVAASAAAAASAPGRRGCGLRGGCSFCRKQARAAQADERTAGAAERDLAGTPPGHSSGPYRTANATGQGQDEKGILARRICQNRWTVIDVPHLDVSILRRNRADPHSGTAGVEDRSKSQLGWSSAVALAMTISTTIDA